MQIAKHLAMAVIGLVLVSPTTPPFRAETGIVRATVRDDTRHKISSAGPSIAPQIQLAPPSALTSAYGMDVPLAYYTLSFTLSKRTGGITPPVQGRIFAYMGLALYESVVGGMPHNRSIASSLHGIGPLPQKPRHQVLASRRERSDGRGDAWAVG